MPSVGCDAVAVDSQHYDCAGSSWETELLFSVVFIAIESELNLVIYSVLIARLNLWMRSRADFWAVSMLRTFGLARTPCRRGPRRILLIL